MKPMSSPAQEAPKPGPKHHPSLVIMLSLDEVRNSLRFISFVISINLWCLCALGDLGDLSDWPNGLVNCGVLQVGLAGC